METILLAFDLLQQTGVSPFEGILLILVGAAVYILALINSQNKKNGYLTTTEFKEFEKKQEANWKSQQKFEKESLEARNKRLTTEEFNSFKDSHDKVHEKISEKIDESIGGLRKEFTDKCDKINSSLEGIYAILINKGK